MEESNICIQICLDKGNHHSCINSNCCNGNKLSVKKSTSLIRISTLVKNSFSNSSSHNNNSNSSSSNGNDVYSMDARFYDIAELEHECNALVTHANRRMTSYLFNFKDKTNAGNMFQWIKKWYKKRKEHKLYYKLECILPKLSKAEHDLTRCLHMSKSKIQQSIDKGIIILRNLKQLVEVFEDNINYYDDLLNDGRSLNYRISNEIVTITTADSFESEVLILSTSSVNLCASTMKSKANLTNHKAIDQLAPAVWYRGGVVPVTDSTGSTTIANTANSDDAVNTAIHYNDSQQIDAGKVSDTDIDAEVDTCLSRDLLQRQSSVSVKSLVLSNALAINDNTLTYKSTLTSNSRSTTVDSDQQCSNEVTEPHHSSIVDSYITIKQSVAHEMTAISMLRDIDLSKLRRLKKLKEELRDVSEGRYAVANDIQSLPSKFILSSSTLKSFSAIPAYPPTDQCSISQSSVSSNTNKDSGNDQAVAAIDCIDDIRLHHKELQDAQEKLLTIVKLRKLVLEAISSVNRRKRNDDNTAIATAAAATSDSSTSGADVNDNHFVVNKIV